MTDLEEPLTPEIADVLAGLPRERRIDPVQADRVLRSLRPAAPRRWIAEIAAAVAIALLAGAAGRASVHPTRGNYMLLVHDDAPAAPSEALGRFQEYSAWAASLRKEHHLAGGEELQDQREILFPDRRVEVRSAGRDHAIGGYFLLVANDDAEALAIARDCPHLRHGGTVELRRITSR